LLWKIKIRDKVREGYGQIAVSETSSCCGPSSCCGADDKASADQLAQAFGYDLEELNGLPEGANMGLSCGNPVALATLKPGETVVDLGSGGGFDVFIAGRKVGETGRVIGVDMTPEMLSKARSNTGTYRENTGLDNVEFRLGEIEHLPLADNSVDVIISNCVINLSPNKAQVWQEIARVLKPGGRVAVSDIALLRPLPEKIVGMVESLIGCVAGAVLIGETEKMAVAAGLTDIEVVSKKDYVDSMEKWNDPLYKNVKDALPAGDSLGQYIASAYIYAVKKGCCCCS
jgi:arsenite methyltransferase